MKEEQVTSSGANVTVKVYKGIWVDGPAIPDFIPGNFEEAWVIDWEAAGIKIPWPKEMSAKEAIIAWAVKEDIREDMPLNSPKSQ